MKETVRQLDYIFPFFFFNFKNRHIKEIAIDEIKKILPRLLLKQPFKNVLTYDYRTHDLNLTYI